MLIYKRFLNHTNEQHLSPLRKNFSSNFLEWSYEKSVGGVCKGVCIVDEKKVIIFIIKRWYLDCLHANK